MNRSLALATITSLLSLTVLAACNSAPSEISSNPNAVVRFVNATNAILDVSNAGVVLPDNANLGYGGSTTCLTVPPSAPTLLVNQTATGASTGFTAHVSNGRQYTIVAYPSATGAIQFATLDNTFRPATGQAGVDVFNGVAGSSPLMAVVNGAPLGGTTAASYGAAGSFTSTPVGASDVAFTSGSATTILFDAGTVTFYDDVRTTLIVVPGATGTGYRALAVTSC